MTETDKSLQIDLAIVQIVTTILITIGATVFALGVGFGIAVPPLLEDIIVNDVPASLQEEIISALNDYGIVLTLIGVVMIITGIIYGLAGISKIKKGKKYMTT